ncbi:hypothetical protein HUT06_29580 [Actinomadura sp. NAK00032]|uniref:hypothetical protein n=1 Tax=Actinomadura sp. NAK00032 TaxID=2742128 RepID=UPI00158FAF87|nr:hypothetical protein [Actinomadura sp. NAK00032]QKW37650.1 hypothetical protein HUT06_29580 [Actinomadura sp. NAK00032]
MTTALELRRLLAPLLSTSECHLRIAVGDDPLVSPAHLLHAVVSAPDMPRGNFPAQSWPPTVEQVDKGLEPLVHSDDQILALLVAACTEDLAYAVQVGPWTSDAAQPLLRQAMHLLGRADWWSNCTLPSSCFDDGDFFDGVERDPVTDHTFDSALIGIGEQATITFLAFAED